MRLNNDDGEVTLFDRCAVAFGSLVISAPIVGLYWLLSGDNNFIVAPGWVVGGILLGFAVLGFAKPTLAADALAACVRALRYFY